MRPTGFITRCLTPCVISVATAFACTPADGPGDKAKVSLEENVATAAADEAAGNWVLVRTINTSHPYRNYQNESWSVAGHATAVRMKVVLDRFELETGYDYLTIVPEGSQVSSRLTGNRTGQEIVANGNVVTLRFDSDYSVTDWGFSVSVYQELSCICAEIYQPVCGTDGTTYGNPCRASCAGVGVVHDGECNDTWTEVDRAVDSPHPYANNYDNTWVIMEPNARRIKAHFSRVSVENGYDFVRIYDIHDNLVHTYSGSSQSVWTPEVEGNTIKIRLVTDYSVTRWGFALDAYAYEALDDVAGCGSDSDCPHNHICTQVICIRAPCPAMCTPLMNTEPVDATLAQLEADPDAYNNQTVRVTAEPAAGPAFCTRMACSPENPCCNSCGSELKIGTVELAQANNDPMNCGGNECTWQRNCTGGFLSEANGPYEFVGLFTKSLPSRLRLAIESFTAADCRTGGCSGQMCGNGGQNLISTCEWREEYACYDSAECTAQGTGHCGWTQSAELLECLDNPGGNSAIGTVHASGLPIAIPDAPAQGITSTLDVIGNGRTADSVSVSLSISHTYRGDLIVDLVAPSGTRVRLHNGAGGSARNLTIQNRDLSQLAGQDPAGTWELSVRDRYRDDTGSLTAWSLTFE